MLRKTIVFTTKFSLILVFSFLLVFSIQPHLLTGETRSLDKQPLFDGLGNHHFSIATQSVEAQKYFDQGIVLTYAFNHAEAFKSFQAAAQLDPSCAMCYWGMSYVLGPNINVPMAESANELAWEMLQKAVDLSNQVSAKERKYIQALSRRYEPDYQEDRSQLNEEYAVAMRRLVQEYPNDLNAKTLFAEALMDTMPWNYWTENGAPKPKTVEVIDTLKTVIRRDPDNPGALHLLIHAVEAQEPELAIEAADHLRDLNINAGHLIHMPSHIYLRVGRYRDAIVANEKAADADLEYAKTRNLEGVYPLGYMPHNHNFLWYSAAIAGQEKIAIAAATAAADLVETSLIREPGFAGTLQHYSILPLYAAVRFGQWNKILSIKSPDADLSYPVGVWHFARGMAFADSKDRLEEAKQELEALKANASDRALEGIKICGRADAADLLNIAAAVLAGTIAEKQENYPEAIAYLRDGVTIEDSLIYAEPSAWYRPVRQLLGNVLLSAKKPEQAEVVFREDLEKYPRNRWSLYGLYRSLLRHI